MIFGIDVIYDSDSYENINTEQREKVTLFGIDQRNFTQLFSELINELMVNNDSSYLNEMVSTTISNTKFKSVYSYALVESNNKTVNFYDENSSNDIEIRILYDQNLSENKIVIEDNYIHFFVNPSNDLSLIKANAIGNILMETDKWDGKTAIEEEKLYSLIERANIKETIPFLCFFYQEGRPMSLNKNREKVRASKDIHGDRM